MGWQGVAGVVPGFVWVGEIGEMEYMEFWGELELRGWLRVEDVGRWAILGESWSEVVFGGVAGNWSMRRCMLLLDLLDRRFSSVIASGVVGMLDKTEVRGGDSDVSLSLLSSGKLNR